MSDKALQSKYNIAVAKAQDLQEQLAVKTRQWDEWKKEKDVLEKNTKDLCKKILAKDKGQTNTGKQKSWDERSAGELVGLASGSFDKYVEQSSKILRDVIDKNEGRSKEIEKRNKEIKRLNNKIERLERDSGISDEELEEEERRKEAEEEAVKGASPDFKDSVESGSITVIPESSDPVPREAVKNRTAQAAYFKKNPKYETVHASPAKGSGKGKAFGQEKPAKGSGEGEASGQEKPAKIDLTDVEGRLSDGGRCVLFAIGGQGLSEFKSIKEYVMGRLPERKSGKKVTESALRTGAYELRNAGLAKEEEVTLPTGQIKAYRLTSLGKDVFEDMSKQHPKKSELEKAISEHSNADHGYGIFYTARALRDTGEFAEVLDENRKSAIDLGGGKKYIPDIICVERNGKEHYLEYEMGTTGENDFKAKCNKMCRITDTLFYISPNRKRAEALAAQVKKWIDSEGTEALADITVKLCSAYDLCNGAMFGDDGTWLFTFKPKENGSEPLVR